MSGSLVTNALEGGYPTQNFPLLPFFQFTDKVNFENCCVYSDFCELYRLWRPVDTCENYIPPGLGKPHLPRPYTQGWQSILEKVGTKSILAPSSKSSDFK